MVAAEAADVKPAAASAALPETKVRLFNISSFGADPMRGGGKITGKARRFGAAALLLDTGIMADLPVYPCYGFLNKM
jgi:hypothetical protein